MPEIDTSGLSENLTRKVGPLPLWAWGGVAVGAYAIFRMIGGRGSSSGSTTTTVTDSTGSMPDLSGGSLGSDTTTTDSGPSLTDIQTELDAISKQLDNQNPGTVKLPPWFKTWLQTHKPGTPPPPPPPVKKRLISYVVQGGDTWAKIAAAHHMTLAQFYKANPTLQKRPYIQRGGGRTIKVYR